MDQEKDISVGSGHQYNGSENSRISAVSEAAVIKINLYQDREKTQDTSISEEHEDCCLKTKGSRLDESNKVENVEEEQERCPSCVIDVNCCVGNDNENEKLGDADSQRVCRICHLSAWESGKSLVDLIELGCGCKGELGFAHSHCAETWFKRKGNRICEICGENARNITGAVDSRFMEEWNENRTSNDDISSQTNRGCWQGQPLCNLLMACLVIAFVLPWFFRVNMF